MAGQPSPSVAEKLDAVRKETQLTQQAVRDTQVRNHYLHRRVSELHEQLAKLDKDSKSEEATVHQLKNKLTVAKTHAQGGASDRTAAQMLADYEEAQASGRDPDSERIRQDTRAVLERHGLPAGKPVPLLDLEQFSNALVKDLRAAKEENAVLDESYGRLLDRKASLERDIAVQLQRNERLQQDVTKAKKVLERHAGVARTENAQTIQLERQLQGAKSTNDKLVNEQKSTIRLNDRLQKKLTHYAREKDQLNTEKVRAKDKALAEASAAEERQKWIDDLRSENERLISFLLNEEQEMAKECRHEEDGHFDHLSELPQPRAKQFVSPSELPATSLHNAERHLLEQKLLDKFGASIQQTEMAALDLKRHAQDGLRTNGEYA